jgi:hypothetical protein
MNQENVLNIVTAMSNILKMQSESIAELQAIVIEQEDKFDFIFKELSRGKKTSIERRRRTDDAG